MKSKTTERFRKAFAQLPGHVQRRARVAYTLFRQNPYHPSLRLKQVHPSRPIYSIRICQGYRAVGEKQENEITWFWLGPHSDYDKLISQL